LVGKIGRLSESTRAALRAAAVLGARVELPTLARVLGWELKAVDDAITEATVARLVDRGPGGDYGFVHNLVREALLSGMGAAVLSAHHQKIAEALDTADVAGDRLYLLAHHYLAGDHSNPARAIAVCVRAGQLAQAESADEDAYRYYRRADELRERTGLPPDPQLDDGLSEVCSRTGRHEEAESYVSRAMSRETNALRRAQLLRRRARVEAFRLENRRAMASLAAAFAEVDERLPTGRAAIAWSAVLWLVAGIIRATGLGRARADARARLQLLSQLFDDAVRVAYFDLRRATLLQAVVRQRYVSERIGPSAELARS
jgi:predicted ATPase